jgi:hypothetical protein
MLELAIAFGAGLIVGWIFFPEPKFLRDFFVRIGLAKTPEPKVRPVV